jgi:SAM-dependent methyltransferase
MHENSRLLFERYAKQYFATGKRVLEIGPEEGGSAYKKLIGDLSPVWDTLDIWRADEKLTYIATDEYSFPIPDNSYDIVLSGQVLEHVRKIWVWMREVARVCKVGGIVVTINPVSWPYHEAPFDCWRAFPEGMRALYEEVGLSVNLSLFNSLETPGYRRYIPGMSLQRMSWKRRAVNQIFGVLGMQVERSYDTVTIGEKKPSPQDK